MLATGAYDFVNLIGVPGEDLPHVSHYFTSPHPVLPQARGHCRRQELGSGGGARAAIAPARTPTIVHRRAALGDSIKYWVKPDIENRIKEGSVAARFNTQLVEITPDAVVVDGTRRTRERSRRTASSC